ncbi:hypothetical protein CJF31_00000908 [Rutstroemia sp. NJR-2017a BVV2]|nr:hypothetical protein CJF31_00000908 [Rutstroemia sp. NJR-2017a BVV2]
MYTHTTSTLHPLYTSALTTISPLVLPTLDTIASMAQASPAAFTVGMLLLAVVVVVKVLGVVRRMVAFGVRVLFGLVFWGAIGVMVAVVWERGVGRTGVEFAGWLREVGGVWWEEWQKAKREREGVEI